MRMKHDPPNPTIQRTPTSAADFDRYIRFQSEIIRLYRERILLFVGERQIWHRG
jgi:hypothetical protein